MPVSDQQLHALRFYAEMLARPSVRFVVAWGAGSSGTGLPAAVNIAGAVSLTVEPDRLLLKSVYRSGGIDFLVTNLDEALRVLKNEIRKHTSVSVGLAAEPDAILAEMNERGVEPDLEVSQARSSLALEHLPSEVVPSGLAADFLRRKGWQEVRYPAATTADLRALDVNLIAATPDAPRRQWLQRIPHYQRPAAGEGRWLWATEAEAASLKQA